MNKTEKLLSVAKKLIGRPYKYGAKMNEAPKFFDCSSFIKYIYGKIDIELPRSTIEQAERGKKINLKNIRAGDLIFFHGTRGHYNKKFPQGIGHVAMVLDNNKIIHATSKRIQTSPKIIEIGGVKIEPLTKIFSPKANPPQAEKRKDIIAIKRILR
jgi:cell wall-associated NlpC family hydrolase